MSTNTVTAQWTAWHFVASLNLLSLVGLRCLNLGCFWNAPGLMRLTMNCFMEELNHQGFLADMGDKCRRYVVDPNIGCFKASRCGAIAYRGKMF